MKHALPLFLFAWLLVPSLAGAEEHAGQRRGARAGLPAGEKAKQ